MTSGDAASTPPTARRRMQLQAERDTGPELALRRELHRLGLRYRLERQIVPGTRRRVDIAFGPAKVAVLVDGCFWHGCPEHGTLPAETNRDFWTTKIAKNRARDRDTDQRLEMAGWKVLRVWEHEPPDEAASRIASVVRRRRGDPS